MAFPTFTPPYPPALNSTNTPEFKVLKASFGDGYEQRVPDGINSVRDVRSYKWEYLSPSEGDAIETFIKGQKGAMPFYFVPPGSIVPQKFICENFSRERVSNGSSNITVTFRQSFDLDA